MRFLIIAAIMVSGSISGAAVKNFNGLIQEASVSEKLLRKKLLRALQNTEIAIASSDERERLQQAYPSSDFQVRLVNRKSN
ncbi:hypothetical protein D3C87_103060 [compost metagenome]